MTTTILIGPADRRARAVASYLLADAAALRRRLRDRGVDVQLVSAFDPGVVGSDTDADLRPDVVLDVPVRSRDQRADGIASAGLLARELAAVAADGVVHAVGWRATAVAVTARAETGVPVVAHADQLPSWPGDDRADGTVMARLGWAALGAADKVVVESTWARDVAVRRGVVPDRLHVVGPALTRLPAEAATAPAADEPLVLSVGDPGDVGSLRPVAEAVLHHPGARLVVAGGAGLDPAAVAAVKERLRELPVVRRLGTRCRVAPEPAASLCRRADLVVDVSSTPGRGLGVLAAMFEARPLVAAAVGGADELVVDRVTGLLVEPRDRVHTRDAVADLLADPFRLEAYGLAGRDRAQAVFDPEQLTDALVAVHERAAGRSERDADEVETVDVRDVDGASSSVVPA
ncbi:glycosyltransferase family 4 protein [Jannaschia sp. R86511]|uniref:glycosyltransferase family 4 protein n=1 Tax=Jannaschia sp. R86511 TaxID=3093853 RepID=UPI0036D2BE77